MMQSMVGLAKKIYLNTPNRLLRFIYFRAFCSLVRNRTVQLSIDEINYKLDLGENIDICLYLNRYEPDMIAAIKRICRPGFMVLDIGANIGAHALRFAKIVGESGRVYAFEPTDYAYQKLLHNISLNQFKNIFPIKIALSDKNLLQQCVRFRSSWPTKGRPRGGGSIVNYMRLDDWCKAEKIERVDLIKLDVDGHEYDVIAGARHLFANQHPIILMEVWGPSFSHNMKNPFISLKQLGYRFYNIDTEEEFASIDDLRAVVSSKGKLTSFSFNIIAKHRSYNL